MTYFVKIRDINTGGVICTDAFDADTQAEFAARLKEYVENYPDAWVETREQPFQ